MITEVVNKKKCDFENIDAWMLYLIGLEDAKENFVIMDKNSELYDEKWLNSDSVYLDRNDSGRRLTNDEVLKARKEFKEQFSKYFIHVSLYKKADKSDGAMMGEPKGLNDPILIGFIINSNNALSKISNSIFSIHEKIDSAGFGIENFDNGKVEEPISINEKLGHIIDWQDYLAKRLKNIEDAINKIF